VTFEEYRRGLIEAGFGEVAVIDSGADLNAYSKAEGQSGCCQPSMKEGAPRSLPAAATSCCAPAEAPGATDEAAGWCCGPAPTAESGARDVLSRYEVNDYAASVKVFAVKPR
ncbi:MAG TPA: hypothetical protein VNZ44_15145, partial [Pyrinomonadaceae bacterium]|nr:hypothetical protein [Pyrinomonadaceae bacterium]